MNAMQGDKRTHTGFSRVQRVALARVMMDLIEADFVVDEGEMACFERAISAEHFGISTAMIVQAKQTDMAKAVETLSRLGDAERGMVVDTLRRLSLSDGDCAAQEAIQLVAMEMALCGEAAVCSVPVSELRIADRSVIYVEGEDDTQAGGLVARHADALRTTFASAGFHFVFVPDVASDFRRLNPDYLKKVIRYMIPAVSSQRLERLTHALREMTTARCCRDLLVGKLGIPLVGVRPSLLLKINESDVVSPFSPDAMERTRYANFLLIPLRPDLLAQAAGFTSRYLALVSRPVASDSATADSRFLYSGFHRSLFDLIAFGREQRDCRLVFDLGNRGETVYLEPKERTGEHISLRLNPRETALFFLIAKKSVDGCGLDWRNLAQIPAAERERLLDEYNAVYRRVGKGHTAASYKDRTRTNHIRNRVAALCGIANKSLFIPENVRLDGKSYYRIRATAQDVVFRNLS